MDEVDIAQKINDEFQTDIQEERRRTRSNVITSRIHCIDCGKEIPPGRRIASRGCQRCVTCQTEIEIINSRRNM